MRRSVRLFGRLMVLAGVLTLAITIGQWWIGNTNAERAQLRTVHRLEQEFAQGDAAVVPRAQPTVVRAHASLSAETALPAEAPALAAGSGSGSTKNGSHPSDDAFALIRIPRFGAQFIRPIVEGTDATQLSQGVGHYRGTAGPGQQGNFAVAGHRTTYGEPFHLIAKLQIGDEITVRTRTNIFTYRVVQHEVVDPSDVQVIAPDPPGVAPGHLMTLTSCHPMYLATQRYVVHARLISTS